MCAPRVRAFWHRRRFSKQHRGRAALYPCLTPIWPCCPAVHTPRINLATKSACNTPETILRVAVCRDVVRTCAHIDTAHSQAHELAPSNTHLSCLPPSQSNEQ